MCAYARIIIYDCIIVYYCPAVTVGCVNLRERANSSELQRSAHFFATFDVFNCKMAGLSLSNCNKCDTKMNK